ncbi:hypothetical protein, partial [Staphylococcus aureus]|uniref:hypothetical protein n=1 Tax=Staphylococcus aureus TaxID=1280 RepID=UPI0019D65DBE
LKWVKGHGTDVGNNKADELARLGYTLPLGQPGQPEEIFKYKITDRTVPTPTLEEIIEEEIIETSAEVSEKGTEEQAEPATTTAPLSARDIAKLNKERATVNPFMRQTAYYFVTGQVRPDTDEQKYMFSTLFKDSVFGERHPQNGYSLVISKYPSP